MKPLASSSSVLFAGARKPFSPEYLVVGVRPHGATIPKPKRAGHGAGQAACFARHRKQ